MKNPLKNPILAAIAAGGALGTGGYMVGKKTGANKMGTAMASEFARLNEVENEQLARSAFMAGLSHKLTGKNMDKQAMLEEIRNESFNNEIEKIAGAGELIRKAGAKSKDILKAIGSHLRGEVRSLRSAGRYGNEILHSPKGSFMKQVYGQQAIRSLGGAPVILAGTAGLGGTAVGMGMSDRK